LPKPRVRGLPDAEKPKARDQVAWVEVARIRVSVVPGLSHPCMRGSEVTQELL
jgi:hypothetical protein